MKSTLVLKQLQMAFLEAKLSSEQNQDEETCALCWSSGCCCGYNHNEDSFITLTEPEYVMS